MTFIRVLGTEFLKLKRAPLPWVLALVYSIAPWMIAFMMSLIMNPELGAKMGLLTAKAELTIGVVDWSAFLRFIALIYAGGIIVIGIFEAFTFGREYVDGTAKNMLTLPIGRGIIVAAKLTVAACWFVCVGALVFGQALLAGYLFGIPDFDPGALAEVAVTVVKIVIQVLLTCTITSWITVVSRGYIAPLGFSLLLLLLGDFFSHTGWGPYVPWSIVLLTAGAAGEGAATPGLVSYIVLIVVFAAGYYGSYRSLDRRDNTQ